MQRMRAKIVISEFMDASAVDWLLQDFDVLYDAGLMGRREDLFEALQGADALIVRNQTQVDQALLDRAPGLTVVGRLGVGLDNIDVSACAARGVAVIPATGANSLAVAEYVMTSCAILLRGAYLSSQEVLAGKWPRSQLSQGRECGGKVLGLVGFGGIGRMVARMAKGMGMRVLAHDPNLAADASIWAETHVAPMGLHALVEQSDAISLHVPLVDSTRNLFDAALIARMKKGAVLINTARGGIVDEAALAQALRDGRLGGAALDVFNTEPLGGGSVLADAPNLLLTPHIAGVTLESNERVSAMIAERVAQYLHIHRTERTG
jgi:(S)-sulfolactate dehydrogenase